MQSGLCPPRDNHVFALSEIEHQEVVMSEHKVCHYKVANDGDHQRVEGVV